MRVAQFLLCLAASAQELHVYSEFARIDPATGEPTAPKTPREILSPAIVRNGFTSFQIVVQVPSGTPYWLYVGQNPEDAVKVTLYRESGETLEKVEQPFQGSQTEILWMDVWTDRDAPVRRIKIEPELNVGRDWVTYPMEARVMDAVVPSAPENGWLPAWVTFRSFVCKVEIDGSKDPNLRAPDRLRFESRNALQDVALAALVPNERLMTLVGGCSGFRPPIDDPEWYLRIRDYVFRLR